jgi:hypothetical protein
MGRVQGIVTGRNQTLDALDLGQLLARRLPALDEVAQLDHPRTKRSAYRSY